MNPVGGKIQTNPNISFYVNLYDNNIDKVVLTPTIIGSYTPAAVDPLQYTGLSTTAGGIQLPIMDRGST